MDCSIVTIILHTSYSISITGYANITGSGTIMATRIRHLAHHLQYSITGHDTAASGTIHWPLRYHITPRRLLYSIIGHDLYDNPSYSRILIGSCLWYVRWRHHYREFSFFFIMAESFENLDKILLGWSIDKVQKSLAEALNRSENLEEERYSRFCWEKIQKKYSCSLSRQSSKTKPSTNLIGREP